MEEVRDAWGRRRLVLVDPKGTRVEVFVTAEADLNESVVYLSSGSNPRDVIPTLIPAAEIARALGQPDGAPGRTGRG